MAKKKQQQDLVGEILSGKVLGFSSGYPMIDSISGVDGILFPRAAITELYGLKSSSKSTLVQETIAFNQLIDEDFKVLYVDFEHSLRNQFDYLQRLGIDTDPSRFTLCFPKFMEDGTNEVLTAVKENTFDMIIVDSVAAMRPKAEDDNGMYGTKQMGLKGKMMSEFCRQLTAEFQADGPAVIFINQLYKDIQSKSFVQLYNTPSSDSLKFYASLRIEVKALEKIKEKQVNKYTLEEDEIPIGQLVAVKTEKNKIGVPFLTAKYMLTFGVGIDIVPTIISAAIKAGAIRFKGNSKSSFIVEACGKEHSIFGMSRLTRFLRTNLDVLREVGSNINEYWAAAMDDVILRMQSKQKAIQGSTSLAYVADDETDADNSEDSDMEETSTDHTEGTGEKFKTLEDAFTGGPAVKKVSNLEDSSEEVKTISMKI